MKIQKIYLSFFIAFFAFGVVFATNASANTTFVKICSATVGSLVNCENSGTGQDQLAYFKNRLVDNYKPTSAYKIYFAHSTNYPSVTRGAPVYGKFYLYDNKAKTHYTYSNFDGKFLNDYSKLQVSTNKTTSYYPASYQKPTTNMYIKNGDPFECGSKITYCRTYIHASEFNVK